MKPVLKLYIFVDALGWEVVEKYDFCRDLFPVRYRVTTQLGYSAGAVPTILSGKSPEEHGHFSFFFYDPIHSPFKWMRFLPTWLLPGFIFNRHRIRHHISKFLGRMMGYTGYFQLYRVPFAHLSKLNYSEQSDIFVPGGLAPVKTLAEGWAGRRFRISNWRNSGNDNFTEMEQLIAGEAIDCGFLYTASFDGYMHRHVSEPEAVIDELARLKKQIAHIHQVAGEHYEEVRLTVFSDHGMTPLTTVTDLGPTLSPYRWGRDYISVLDSTMARFWFIRPELKDELTAAVAAAAPGHWLTPEELRRFRIDFADHKYGDAIFLLDPGAQLAPSDMGDRALPGMHGYTPDDADSDASFLSTHEPGMKPQWIGDFHTIMVND